MRLGLAVALARAAGGDVHQLDAPTEESRMTARDTPLARHGAADVDVPHRPGDKGSAEPKRRKPRDKPLVDRHHRPRQGQEHVGVRDAAALVGARLPLRRLSVREVRQVEGRRGEGRGRARRHRLGEDGRRLVVDLEGPRRVRRPRPRGLGRGQARDRRRALRVPPARRDHLPDQVGLDRGRRRRRDAARPARAFSTSSSRAATPPPELLELADLVSEVVKVKHPMDEGIRAQQGIEW